MSINYTKLQKTALSLLTKSGQNVTLSTSATGSYDETTSSAVVTPTSTTRKAAVFPYPPGKTQINGALIQKDDQRCIMDATGVEPTPADSVTVGADTYAIISVLSIKPAGIAVVYDIHLRKGA